MASPFTTAQAKGQGMGFSLIELLVVIAIIGVIAAIGLPALRGFGESNAMDAAKRQILDDLALARLRAINERTTVYLLFVPPEITEVTGQSGLKPTNLFNLQYSSYVLFTERGAGEQPGRARPRFLTEWKHLPDGIFIAPFKVTRDPYPQQTSQGTDNVGGFLSKKVSYSTRYAEFNNLPCRYVAFNAFGQLELKSREGLPMNEIIPLAKGSIFYSKNGKADVVETPPFSYTNNIIRVNWLTGRARIEKRELR